MDPQVRAYRIGPQSILLPPGHMLDQYQSRWKRYNTAALVCKYGPVPVLCIEGNPAFVPLLRQNAAALGAHIECEVRFIGPDGHFVDASSIHEEAGTASVLRAAPVPAEGSGTPVPMRGLDAVLPAHPLFAGARLLKIDTDGLDFPILLVSLDLLRRLRPVLFFECDTRFSPMGDADAGRAIDALFSIGYSRFVVYDNFGNFLMTIRERERFAKLSACLRSNRMNFWVIYYFDVCAFADGDTALFDLVRDHELAI